MPLMNSHTTDGLTEDRLVTVRTAAELTSLSPDWFKRRVASGEFPSIRVGRARRLRLDDVRALIRVGWGPARRSRKKGSR